MDQDSTLWAIIGSEKLGDGETSLWVQPTLGFDVMQIELQTN